MGIWRQIPPRASYPLRLYCIEITSSYHYNINCTWNVTIYIFIRLLSERRVIATENDILQTLYDRYYSAALLYTTAVCADAELARDIVADAFLKAYITLPREIPSFQFWLFRVCKNLWIDHLRKQPILLSEEHLLSIADHHTPESLYLQNERYQCLWQGIHSLPPIDREIVTLHYFSELPLPEVAQLVGKSYPAVRQRLTRLRRILKQRMEEHGYDF